MNLKTLCETKKIFIFVPTKEKSINFANTSENVII